MDLPNATQFLYFLSDDDGSKWIKKNEHDFGTNLGIFQMIDEYFDGKIRIHKCQILLLIIIFQTIKLCYS